MAKSTKRNQKKRKQTLKRKRCGKTIHILGGSTNLAELPIRYYYEYNDKPNYMSEQIKGGRRKKRKMNGGSSLSTGINSFGTFFGIPDTYRVVTAEPVNDYLASPKYITGNIPTI
jgi:hypothetical protein